MNLFRWSFVEGRRRSKTLSWFVTERRCIKLVFATLIRVAERWQRIAITRLEQEQLKTPDPEGSLTPAQPVGRVT